MKTFIKTLGKFLSIGLFLVLLLLTGYFLFDPFKVLYKYSDYSYPIAYPNRDFVSTEMFLKNYKLEHYNSFIFGSSRTMAFTPAAWKKHLNDSDKVYVFDASGEPLIGVYQKLIFLESKSIKIDNVIILICRDVTFRYFEHSDDHLNTKHPLTSNKSRLIFQTKFIKAYFDPKFIFSYYTYRMFHKMLPYMKGIIVSRRITFDTITNKLTPVDQDSELAADPIAYYKNMGQIFRPVSTGTIDTLRRIDSNHVAMLKEIKRIFQNNRTKYRIIISPLYNQVGIHPKDLAILTDIFGKNVYNYSGRNSFTMSKENYYEPEHFRPTVGDSILNAIYN